MATQPIQSPRGMNDVFPPDSAKWNFFENRCRDVFHRYGYAEIRTPIVEATELFARGVGEATDIVEKEMYTFPDRRGRSLTMRPEMTASCVRAYIQHGLAKRDPNVRWYYMGPMFRYERMQTGRYRQFYQIGVEAFGASEPTVDAEQIAMLHALYDELKVPGLTAVINSVGNADDRPRYRAALVDYLTPFTSSLCADCVRRLDKNPLRVLDCKQPTCRDIARNAPSILEHLGDTSRQHFEQVQATLGDLGTPFQVDASLVRGLDYYTGTVIELMSDAGDLGAHNTIAAGGRYDDLVKTLGGPPTPAVGFALGVERAILSMPGASETYVAPPAIYFAPQGATALAIALRLASEVRAHGLTAEVDHRSVRLKAQLKRANRKAAPLVAIIGEDELATNTVMLRNMSSSEQQSIPAPTLPAEVQNQLARRSEL